MNTLITLNVSETSAQEIKNLLDEYQQIKVNGYLQSMFVEYVSNSTCQYFFSPNFAGKQTATWAELAEILKDFTSKK